MGYCATNLNFQSDIILIYIINIKLRTKLYSIACDTNLIKNFILLSKVINFQNAKFTKFTRKSE